MTEKTSASDGCLLLMGSGMATASGRLSLKAANAQKSSILSIAKRRSHSTTNFLSPPWPRRCKIWQIHEYKTIAILTASVRRALFYERVRDRQRKSGREEGRGIWREVGFAEKGYTLIFDTLLSNYSILCFIYVFVVYLGSEYRPHICLHAYEYEHAWVLACVYVRVYVFIHIQTRTCTSINNRDAHPNNAAWYVLSSNVCIHRFERYDDDSH